MSHIVIHVKDLNDQQAKYMGYYKHCVFLISMDFVTNLFVTHEDNDTLFVDVDKFPKMIHLIPMKQTNDAPTVARLFREHEYKLHGLPKIIISDRDPRFTSSFWQTLFKYFRTKLHMSTAYHPQTDGQTEIMNKITQTILRTILQSKIDEWDKYIADIRFSYNNTVSQSTGYTPFYLNTGKHPLTPIIY